MPSREEEAMVRVNFQLYDADNPRLAVELRRFNKGKRRTARLSMLATYGIVYEQLLLSRNTRLADEAAHLQANVESTFPSTRTQPSADSETVVLTNEQLVDVLS